MVSELLLDLRGLRCPWPAIRVARAIREAGPDAPDILAVADDPIAPREIGAVGDERGWSVTPEITEIGPGLRLSASAR